MSQPPPYVRFQDYSQYQADNPLPGPALSGPGLNAEFDRIKTTSDLTLANLSLVQRDDGKIRNGIIHPDALSSETITLMGAWNPRGVWATATSYKVRDVVSYVSGSYFAAADHTSGGSFQTDLEAGLWLPLFDTNIDRGIGVMIGRFGHLQTTTEMILAAMDYVSLFGGGVVLVPPGVHTISVLAENLVGPDEGTAITFNAAHSNITLRGAGIGATVFRAPSNKIAFFENLGAMNVGVEGITFDNSEHGPLQNQVKPGGRVPGGGVAGQGNAANCAIRQYSGGGLSVSGCEFIDFLTAIEYQGDYQDDQRTVGTVSVVGNQFVGCCFGLLTQQPEHVVCDLNGYFDGIDSVLSGGDIDPGHLLYVANTGGAHPETVQANNNRARNATNSPIKMRKGKRQVSVGNVFQDVGRGITSHRSQTVTIVGNTIGLIDSPLTPDTQSDGIQVTGCERGGVVQGNTIDRSGSAAFGVRLRPPGYDPPEEPDDDGESIVPLNNVSVLDNIIIDDLSHLTPREAFVQVTAMTGGEIRGNTCYITGNVALDGTIYKLIDCTDVIFRDNSRRSAAAGTPSGSDRLASDDASCVNCKFFWERNNIDVAPTGNTIGTLSSSTTIIRTDGSIVGDWVPAPTFATVGDFVPANVAADGWYERRGSMVTAGGRLAFDTNAHTTASGEFRITGFPWPANSFGIDFGAALTSFAGITGTSEQIGVRMGNGSSFFTLRDSDLAGAGGALVVANFPASTAGFVIEFQITVRITED